MKKKIVVKNIIERYAKENSHETIYSISYISSFMGLFLPQWARRKRKRKYIYTGLNDENGRGVYLNAINNIESNNVFTNKIDEYRNKGENKEKKQYNIYTVKQ